MGRNKEWALSLEEKKILGEKRIKEYQQKVKEYSIGRTVQAVAFTIVTSPFAIALAGVIATKICRATEFLLPRPVMLAIACTTFFTIIMAAATLTFLISKKFKLADKQNPKDWKAEILRQESLKKGSFSKKVTEDSLKNTPLEINV